MKFKPGDVVRFISSMAQKYPEFAANYPEAVLPGRLFVVETANSSNVTFKYTYKHSTPGYFDINDLEKAAKPLIILKRDDV